MTYGGRPERNASTARRLATWPHGGATRPLEWIELFVESCDAIIIGAGVAGLSAARTLRELGFSAKVLERARGVGGRCATRRVGGQPVDHGLAFLHGRDPRFLAEIEAVGGTQTRSWPLRVRGRGSACQPRAFDGHEVRTAFAEGISCFAKHLATGTDVTLERRVTRIELARDQAKLVVVTESGESFEGRALILAMPIAQAHRLVEPLQPHWPELESLRPLLALPRSTACLTVIARYPAQVRPPEWDLWLPEDSSAIQSILHDSSKRGPGAALTLVVQARPAWSRVALADVGEGWGDELLADVAERTGDWAARPEVRQLHVWRYARIHSASELKAPLLVPLGAGSLLGWCGDAFDAAGGVEGAFRSGSVMAERVSAALAAAPRSHAS